MKKKKALKKLDTVVNDATLKIMLKNPSSLPKNIKDGIKVGDIIVKRDICGVNIYRHNTLLYAGIQESCAVQSIVNRLVSNIKIKEIPSILKLENDYVKVLNDIKFTKHRFNSISNADDKEILEHRLLVMEDKLYVLKDKLETFINL